LADLRMPGIDGVEMLRQLHGHPQFAQVAVIVITGLNDDEIAELGDLPDGTQVLRKPVDMGWLRGYFQAMLTIRLGPKRRGVSAVPTEPTPPTANTAAAPGPA
jgi:CheY-like chemotaxis protein